MSGAATPGERTGDAPPVPAGRGVRPGSPPRVELVVLDCDGVLIDSEVISARVLVELAAEAGIAFDAAYVARHFLGRSFPTVARTIREGWGRPLPAGFEQAYRARLLARFEGELRLTRGVLDHLDRLAVPAVVATSSSPQRAARSLAIVGLADRFPRIFTASEVERGKPAPDLFLHAARAMGVEPARCLVVEDSAPGLAAAAAAGMQAAFYAGGSHLAAGRGGGFDTDPPHRAFPDWAALARAFPAVWRDGPNAPAAAAAPADPDPRPPRAP